jgi:RNA polymerase sigma-70 factor (ECF subfamily)
MSTETAVALEFQENRERLLAIATRVLGNAADAEDVVQEAWLRLSRQEPGSVRNLPGWLTTVVGRLSIDVLRSRATKSELPFATGMPEPVVVDDPSGDGDPEEQALQTESLGLALLVVLASLRAEERLAFVLHDLFGVPFSEIGPIIGSSADAAKMTASRARHKVRGAQPPSGSLRRQRQVVDAFLAAARDGDFDALLRILHPDLTWELHGARGTSTRGRADLLRAVKRGAGSGYSVRRVLVDGRPGVLSWNAAGVPVALMACFVEGGRMIRVVSLTDRNRLGRLRLPDSGLAG